MQVRRALRLIAVTALLAVALIGAAGSPGATSAARVAAGTPGSTLDAATTPRNTTIGEVRRNDTGVGGVTGERHNLVALLAGAVGVALALISTRSTKIPGWIGSGRRGSASGPVRGPPATSLG